MSTDSNNNQSDCCNPERRGPNSERIPELVVHTHESKRAVLYRDLIQGKIVLINLMSIAYHDTYPATANLVKFQDLLGDRLGQDIFMYSITLDPKQDSPQALANFVKKHGVKPGWTFLTGEEDNISQIVSSLFGDHAHCHAPQQADHGEHLTAEDRAAAQDCTLGAMRYGNEPLGIWAAVPAKSDPIWIAERLSWILPRKATAGKSRRGGPAPLNKQHPVTARILES